MISGSDISLMWYCKWTNKSGNKKSTVELKLSLKATSKSFSKHKNVTAQMEPYKYYALCNNFHPKWKKYSFKNIGFINSLLSFARICFLLSINKYNGPLLFRCSASAGSVLHRIKEKQLKNK